MSAQVWFSVVATAGLCCATMFLFGSGKKKGSGVEIFIPSCSSVKGCRFAIYKEAEKKGARLITPRIEGAISGQNGGSCDQARIPG